mgnify:CR=1 FL=1
MDRIFISALAVDAVIGIYDWERKVKQHLEIDLEIWMDLRAAAKSDAIEDTLNYKSGRQARARLRGGELASTGRGARGRDRAHRARGVQGRARARHASTSQARSAILRTSASSSSAASMTEGLRCLMPTSRLAATSARARASRRRWNARARISRASRLARVLESRGRVRRRRFHQSRRRLPGGDPDGSAARETQGRRARLRTRGPARPNGRRARSISTSCCTAIASGGWPAKNLPHPDLSTRPGCWGRLAELAPGLIHPVAGERIDELWRRFDQGAHRLTPVSLERGLMRRLAPPRRRQGGRRRRRAPRR